MEGEYVVDALLLPIDVSEGVSCMVPVAEGRDETVSDGDAFCVGIAIEVVLTVAALVRDSVVVSDGVSDGDVLNDTLVEDDCEGKTEGVAYGESEGDADTEEELRKDVEAVSRPLRVYASVCAVVGVDAGDGMLLLVGDEVGYVEHALAVAEKSRPMLIPKLLVVSWTTIGVSHAPNHVVEVWPNPVLDVMIVPDGFATPFIKGPTVPL